MEELKRIQVIREKKKLETKETKGLELHQNMMASFMERFGDAAFGRGFETSSEVSEGSREDGSLSSEARRRLFFDDVMRIKPRAVADPSNSKIQVAEVPSKELEKEGLFRTRSMRLTKPQPPPDDPSKSKTPTNALMRAPSEISSAALSEKHFEEMLGQQSPLMEVEK